MAHRATPKGYTMEDVESDIRYDALFYCTHSVIDPDRYAVWRTRETERILREILRKIEGTKNV